MIVHLVLLRIRRDVSDDRVRAVFDEIAGLREKIEGIESLCTATSLLPTSRVRIRRAAESCGRSKYVPPTERRSRARIPAHSPC